MSRYKEFDGYEQLIHERLSKKRFTHSVNVAEACWDLADRFGGDKKRCYLAGMLHDIMKEDIPEKQRQMTIDSGLQPDPAEIDTPALWHAVAGAAYVRDKLNIHDEEIITGIRFHTIGCAKLTLLEKIVYLGDMISAERSYKDVERFRKICHADLDKAMSVALAYNITEVCRKCGHIPVYTFQAYNYYLKYNKDKETL